MEKEREAREGKGEEAREGKGRELREGKGREAREGKRREAGKGKEARRRNQELVVVLSEMIIVLINDNCYFI